jgi:hypothetical protein
MHNVLSANKFTLAHFKIYLFIIIISYLITYPITIKLLTENLLKCFTIILFFI